MLAVLSIEKYLERISTLLDVKYESRWDLDNPDKIIEKIPEKNRTITWIKGWEVSIEKYWDKNHFYELFFKGLINQKILLLTHCGVYRRECYEFDIASFYEFAEWYDEKYEESFMQYQDYIIILENNLIKAIHHGGIIMEQHSPMLDKEISEK